MAGVPRTGFLPYPGEKLSPDDPARDPDVWNVLMKDLEAAPGRFWQMLVGDPGTALNVLGTSMTTPNSIPVTEDEFIQQMIQKGELQQAADVLGGMVGTSGVGVASTLLPEQELLSIFAGPRSQTADREALNDALEAAKNMKEVNASKGFKGLTSEDVQDIFASTGWFPGVDGKWRYEIPDTVRARAGMPNPDQMFMDYAEKEKRLWGPRATPEVLWRNARVDVPELTRQGTLSQFIQHPELFEAYPELANLGAKFTGAPGMSPSGVNNMDGTIEASAGTQTDLVSVGLHEIQHQIQLMEGFANGGNPEAMGQYLAQLEPSAMEQLNFPNPYAIYRALMGEVEARQVQDRYELGYAAGNDPRIPGVAPTLDTSPEYPTGGFGMDIPREWQLNPMWFANAENVPGSGGEAFKGEALLKDRLRAYAAKLRDDEANKFMKAASK
jgi:hypothetical protein